ncbi:MAG TPA: hypothetical protein VJA21_11085 [Verrucomicrobiae bacterium]
MSNGSVLPRAESVVNTTVQTFPLKDHFLGNQLIQGLLDFCNHVSNASFQEPPFRDTLNRVLGISMGAQIAQYPHGNHAQAHK